MWALGCVLYELATLRRAFDGQSLPALVVNILRGKYPPVSTRYSSQLRGLIDSMLRQDPKVSAAGYLIHQLAAACRSSCICTRQSWLIERKLHDPASTDLLLQAAANSSAITCNIHAWQTLMKSNMDVCPLTMVMVKCVSEASLPAALGCL